jgi:pimeloyl-ACP methyl ester carboxylesterase
MPISRRSTIAGAASVGLVATPADARGRRRGKVTFILVHGSFLGGWIWSPVAAHLQRSGHRVFHPSMTGCGDRRHLLNEGVGLQTHIDDVRNLIAFEGLSDVVLVGHSFAGITITGVANQMGEKLRGLIFYDAFVPTRARPAWVMPDASGRYSEAWIARTKKFVNGYGMNFHDFYPMEMLVPADNADVGAFVRARLTPHPMKQWTDPVSFSNGGWERARRIYIQPTRQTVQPSSEAMWGPAKGEGWDFCALAVPRLGMLTDPALFAEALESAAFSL